MTTQAPSVVSINALLQAGDFAAARAEIIRLCEAEPDNLQAWYGRAAISAQSGALDDVAACCRRILAIEPGDLSALYNLGTALVSLRHYDEAIRVYEDLLVQQPGNAAALANLAAAQRVTGHPLLAISRAEQALALDANMHPARNILGLAHLDMGNAAAAAKPFRELTTRTPNADTAHHNLGLALLALNDAAGAASALRNAVQLNPANADAAVELSRALHKQGDHAAAMEAAERAAAQFPSHAGAQDALGIRHTELGNLESAHTCFERARALAPQSPDILCHLGNSLIFRGDVLAALACYEESLRIHPDHAQSHWQRAWSLLLLGRLSEGWKEYEWRFQAGIAQLPGHPQPLWQGESLEGRRILLFGEQGFGDSIQFVRYAELVKQRGAHVIVHCRKELKTLFATCPGVDMTIDETDPLPAFDVQAPLLSLPRLFDTALETIPARIPYLSAPTDRHAPPAIINRDTDRLKVGITWCGNPEFRWNRFRSCTLAEFKPLAHRQDIQLYSLQKGTTGDELREHPDFAGAVDLGRTFRDFADTAAAMQQLDIIITTDTSVVHLAGALGRETWLLLSYAADWRWLLARTDSPWYPSLRLFRQPTPDDWATPMQAIIQALAQRMRDA
jgi:tetratricopeptide (TPR) repeat protein